MKRTFWCIPVFLLFCILSVKADVLGPYIMDSNVPDTPAGYGRIVLPISGVYVPVNASITVCDEGGKQYVLTAREPGVPPYCYFLACGIYRVVSIRPRACFSPSYNKVKSQTKHVWLLTLL